MSRGGAEVRSLSDKKNRGVLAGALKWGSRALEALFKLLPLRERTLFYSIRGDGVLDENCAAVYAALGGKRKILAVPPPHSPLIMPKIYYYLLTSRVIVTDDYLHYLRYIRLRPEQRVYQLWHACGAFKKFGLDAPSPLTREQELATHSQYTAFTVSSEHCRLPYARAVGLPLERVLALGVPRTDALLDKRLRMSLASDAVKRNPVLAGKKIYIWCPTFRDRDGVYEPFSARIDWRALDGALGDDEVFVIKRHPAMREKMLDGEYRRVVDLSGESASALLCAASVLMTDYSSLVFDAAILGLPCVFYCPDLDEYGRDFYIDIATELPGEVIADADDIPAALRRAVQTVSRERLEAFRRLHTGACNGHSTERIVALIARRG